jgi:alpha-ketoglutarate-dependent taurine dioxygenase
MDLYEQVAADPAVGLAFKLRPGDIQILNNHVTLHARSAFEDEPGRERLLLRFLVSVLDRAGQ